MPLPELPPAVQTMLDERRALAHPSLDLTLSTGDIVHICTEELSSVLTDSFGVINYVADLRAPGDLNESITLSVNRLDLRAQNVDGVLGMLLSEPQALDGATGILSLIFVDDSNLKYQIELMHGEAVNSDDKDPDVSFQLVADTSTDGPIGGYRTMQDRCFNRYKIDPRCNSLSPLGQGCSKLKFGLNGCVEHLAALRIVEGAGPADDNIASYTGFIDKIRPLPGTPPAGPTGVVDAGDDFNSYFKARQSLGDYRGRNIVPQYFVP